MTGRLTEARTLLKRAITMEPALRVAALDDPDLEPLWERIGRPDAQ